MTFKAICELLPGLTQAEVKQIRERCNALLGSGIVGNTATITKKILLVRADKDDWYAHAVGRYSYSKGWCAKGEISIYLSQKALALHQLADYHLRSKRMRANVEARLGKGFRSDQLEKIGDVMVESVALRIEKTNEWLLRERKSTIFLDGFTLLNRVDSAIEALGEQLPGYLENGMLGLVINARGGVNVKPNSRVQG